MTFDRDVDIGMLLQELRIGLQRALLAAANIVLVVIEVDVLHILREQFFFRGVRSGLSRRCVYGYTSGSVLASSRALSDQMVGCRICWSDLAGAALVDGTNALNADVRRSSSLPSQGRRLTRLNRVRVR